MVEKIQMITPTSQIAAMSGGRSASDRNDPFQGLNLDKLGLSKDAQNKVMWAKAQFEVNYQSLRSINSSQGIETSQESFSFQASYEFLQNASGGEPLQTGKEPEAGDQDTLTQLQDYFSPENTAQRILDVATSFFAVSETGQKEGNTEAGRKKFAEFIGGAINTGFSQAREILGKISEEIETGIEKTHSLVFAGLDDFIKNGIDPEKARPGSVFDKIAAYRLEASANFARRVKSSSAGSYNANGDKQETTTSNPTISTKA